MCGVNHLIHDMTEWLFINDNTTDHFPQAPTFLSNKPTGDDGSDAESNSEDANEPIPNNYNNNIQTNNSNIVI